MIPKVASWKEGRVAELKEIISSPGVVGIIDIGGVPAKNMLDMRSSLKGIVNMTMAKKTLMRLVGKKLAVLQKSWKFCSKALLNLV